MVKSNETKKPVAVKKVAEKKPLKKATPKKGVKTAVKKGATKKSDVNNAPSYVVLNHDLLTQNYTMIIHEADYKFNAPHHFKVIAVKPDTEGEHKGQNLVVGVVNFQEGPIKENGVNGVANEDLLGMVLCRLESFQKSEYKCRENACAITKVEEALMWLRKRTNARVKRGVEGTSKV